MGALGLMYGAFISDQTENDAVFLLSEERMARYGDKIFTVNGKVVAPAMQAEESAEPADLVLVSVKYNDLESAMDTMRNCVGKDTIILSLLNGITSEEIIAKRYGAERIVHTVAQGMDAVKIGDDLTYTQMGKLHVGVPQGMDDKNLKAVVRYFESIGLPYKQEEDIIQTCMAFETDYAGCLAPGQAHDTFISAMKEVIRIADAEGVNLTEDAIGEYIEIVRSLKPDSIPSMRQDSLQKRRTEVDLFAGTVIRIAEKHGISVPANEFLYCRAKEIEASYHE